MCSRTIKEYETYFKCMNCQPEVSHLICSKCFYNGNHEGHIFFYFNNKGEGGTCNCGDPNLKHVVSCKEHIEFSEKMLKESENLISQKHRSQIEKYFFKKFKDVFYALQRI